MRILHIIRSLTEKTPLEVAHLQQEQGHKITILLLHDAVLRTDTQEFKTYLCAADARARNLTGGIEYSEIINLLTSHDRVISW